MRLRIAILTVLIFSFGVKAFAFEASFDEACKEFSVSKALAMAIAKHESGMNPLALNIDGKSYFPGTIEEAKMLIAHAHKSGASYDVGLMQINSYWINRWKIPPESLLEPVANIKAGVRILGAEIGRLGFSWEAVGAYHSPNLERGRRYAWTIFNTAAHVNNKTKQTNTIPAQVAKIQTPAPAAPEINQVSILKRATYGTKKERHQGLLLQRRSSIHSNTGITGRIIRF